MADYSEVYTLMSVGEGVTRATANVQSTILFAGVGTFTYEIPKGMTVLDVQGAGIRDWKAGDDGKLRVVLKFEAEATYALTVQMERAQQNTTDVGVPVLVPIGSERTKGWLGVESSGNLEIEESSVAGATAVEVRSLPGSILGLTGQPRANAAKRGRWAGVKPKRRRALRRHEGAQSRAWKDSCGEVATGKGGGPRTRSP